MIDLHTHTKWSDGKGTPQESVVKALELKMEALGFSDHGYAEYDWDCCMKDIEGYRADIRALAEKYAGQMKILCGIEQDYWSVVPPEGYDYVIGSVHYLRFGEEYITIDNTPQITEKMVEEHFDGDWYAFAEEYFSLVSDLYDKTKCDIVGHFDLLTKFNENGCRFDESNPRYRKAWQSALNRLLECGCVFEINTGAMSRGWRTSAYPNAEIREYIVQNGGKLILSSDCHTPDNLCYAFQKYDKYVTPGAYDAVLCHTNK